MLKNNKNIEFCLKNPVCKKQHFSNKILYFCSKTTFCNEKNTSAFEEFYIAYEKTSKTEKK